MAKKLLTSAAIVMMTAFSTAVMAQTDASETTDAGTTLIVPMTITEDSPLHFGNIVLPDATGGTVELSTANARSFTGTGVSASPIGPTSTNAAYSVTGTYNKTYALTLPATITLTETIASTGVRTMDISALTVLFSGGVEQTGVGATSTLSATGTDSFAIGGTLTVAALQIAGIYEGTFPVSVDYN